MPREIAVSAGGPFLFASNAEKVVRIEEIESPCGALEGKMVEICDLGFVLIVPLRPADLGAAVRLQDAP